MFRSITTLDVTILVSTTIYFWLTIQNRFIIRMPQNFMHHKYNYTMCISGKKNLCISVYFDFEHKLQIIELAVQTR